MSSRRINALASHLAPHSSTTQLQQGVVAGTTSKRAEYDFIVVGAGSSGCVVASRLSENANVRVLLLEAGTAEPFSVKIPGLCIDHRQLGVDWNFLANPSPGLNNREMLYPRGKMLSGSSGLNNMLYVRGPAENYDHWVSLGADGWSYKEVLPYFKKSESCLVPGTADELRGRTGPLTVSVTSGGQPNQLSKLMVKALDEVGVPEVPDYNTPEQLGAGLCQSTVENGFRCSTATAFLEKLGANKRPNLTIATGAYVTKVLFENNTAVGVEYVLDSSATADGWKKAYQAKALHNVYAKKEVILAAGAIQTPQILLLSGIGPKEEIQKHGINLIVDSPHVGRNLQDHLFSFQLYSSRPEYPLGWPSERGLYHILEIGKFFMNRSGILASGVIEAMGFTRTKYTKRASPDLQIHFSPSVPEVNALGKLGLATKYYTDLIAPAANYGCMFLPTLLQPKSRGSVTLKSANPVDPPVIDMNYLAEPSDVDVLVEGHKLCRKAARSKVLGPVLGDELIDTTIPYDPETDEYLREYVRRTSVTVYHPTSTTRIGKSIDQGVVDARLRVYGVKSLRVIDSSIAPELVAANTNAMAIMIGEKGSDLVKEDNSPLFA